MAGQGFFDQLEQSFAEFSQPLPSQLGALVCVLVDHWQELREEYGYAGLFSLRKQIDAELRRHFNEVVDVLMLSESGLVALVKADSSDSLEASGRSLFDALARKVFDLGSDGVAITATVGFCPFDLRFTDGSRMLTETVSLAEDLRRHGGNEWLSISPNVSAAQASADKRRMLGLLMESLRNNKLHVVYQALLPTHGEDVHCFQMLPRLKAADGELIPAADFLPVARSASLLPTLDRWMLSRAVQLLSSAHRHDPIRLFVSQAEELLVNEERRARLAKMVGETSVLEDRLVLDFHLTDTMAHLNGADKLLALARELGVGICLSQVDDHSNWTLLEGRLRCDYLRMAPDFVRRLARSDDLAHDLDELTQGVRANGAQIIMPMIEDAGAAAHLWGSAVDYLQGNIIQPAQGQIRLSD